MNPPIPKRLRQEPLIEVIWQVQFEPAPNQNVGEILPGILCGTIRKDNAQPELKRLPAAEIPPQVATVDANLRCAAKYRIESPGSPYLTQIGDRIVTLSYRRPYGGWSDFQKHIHKLIEGLETSGLIPQAKRQSLRYIDLPTLDQPPPLADLNVSVRVGIRMIDAQPLQLRVELPDDGCSHVLQIVTPANVSVPEGERQGTLVDTETFAEVQEETWASAKSGLDALHTASKALFFKQLLTQDSIIRMQPEY